MSVIRFDKEEIADILKSLEWLESHYDCKFKNVQYDNENPEYVKAFFEVVTI